MLTVPLSKTYWSLPRPNQTNGKARQPTLTYPVRPPEPCRAVWRLLEPGVRSAGLLFWNAVTKSEFDGHPGSLLTPWLGPTPPLWQTKNAGPREPRSPWRWPGLLVWMKSQASCFGVLGWRDSISSGYVPPELQRSNHFGAKSTPKEKRRGGQNENQPEFPC
jgi:hypothetical protein